MLRLIGLSLLVVLSSCGSDSPTGPKPGGLPASSTYFPDWHSVEASNVITLNWDAGLSATQNGAIFESTAEGLEAGDRLILSGGIWSVSGLLDLALVGNATAPIFIEAAEGQDVTLTRSDTAQNTVNIGLTGPARYLAIRGIIIEGGSHLIRLDDAQQIWIDNCEIRFGSGDGIVATNTMTARLHITRNEIHHTNASGPGFGIRLGGAEANQQSMDGIIAENSIHDLEQSLSEGIRIDGRSVNMQIVGNTIRGTAGPAIRMVENGGLSANIVERNQMSFSNDTLVYLHGDVIFQNNFLYNAGEDVLHTLPPGIASPLQGVQLIHNTVIEASQSGAMAMRLSGWGNSTGLVFANNVVYSRAGISMKTDGGEFSFQGMDGVATGGNIRLGDVVGPVPEGIAIGVGLDDFLDFAWDYSATDARPSADSSLKNIGSSAWSTAIDIDGNPRNDPPTAGAYER